jgi:hypothetical protein
MKPGQPVRPVSLLLVSDSTAQVSGDMTNFMEVVRSRCVAWSRGIFV